MDDGVKLVVEIFPKGRANWSFKDLTAVIAAKHLAQVLARNARATSTVSIPHAACPNA